MTKEELFVELSAFSTVETLSETCMLEQILDKFFASNIVIPKGTNPHPYADVVHAYAEGIACEYRAEGGEWITWKEYGKNCEYRIKPQEPVYEWQWYFIQRDGTAFVEHKFYADGELSTDREWHKIEETKRERK